MDSISALVSLKNNPLFYNSDFSIGVAFNPFLPDFLFDEEIKRLEKKLRSGIVNSIWIQFGTDISLLESRLDIIKSLIKSSLNINSKITEIRLLGSILIPSKQFLARFKYRPWKGVYCSSEFLESVDYANDLVVKLLETYMNNDIQPIIETDTSTKFQLASLSKILNS